MSQCLKLRCASPDEMLSVSERPLALERREDAAEVQDGPRHDDAVGTLESWADGWLAIRRRDGRLTTVDEAALVAGKVIPETPPRRPRPT